MDTAPGGRASSISAPARPPGQWVSRRGTARRARAAEVRCAAHPLPRRPPTTPAEKRCPVSSTTKFRLNRVYLIENKRSTLFQPDNFFYQNGRAFRRGFYCSRPKSVGDSAKRSNTLRTTRSHRALAARAEARGHPESNRDHKFRKLVLYPFELWPRPSMEV